MTISIISVMSHSKAEHILIKMSILTLSFFSELCKCLCRYACFKTHLGSAHPFINQHFPKFVVTYCHNAPSSFFDIQVYYSIFLVKFQSFISIGNVKFLFDTAQTFRQYLVPKVKGRRDSTPPQSYSIMMFLL